MREPKPPRFVTLAIMTTITIIFWVFFSVYQAITSQAETTVPQTVLEELNPTLDTTTLNSLSERAYYQDSDIVGFTVDTAEESESTTPVTEEISEVTEISEELPTATESAQPNAN